MYGKSSYLASRQYNLLTRSLNAQMSHTYFFVSFLVTDSNLDSLFIGHCPTQIGQIYGLGRYNSSVNIDLIKHPWARVLVPQDIASFPFK